MDEKETLLRYLRAQRTSLLGKLDGLGEYDIRRPLTPTGTNLLGLVKHVAGVQLDYFGEVFGRPAALEPPWLAQDAEPNADMWATPEETRDEIVQLHRFSAEHSDATIEALPLDAPGEVPWWGDDRHVTLHQILVHMCVETARHAGHADIVRELVDGAVGSRRDDPNIPAIDWPQYRDRVEAAARASVRVRRAGP
ncbi:DinB family protein [Cellulomonas fengjieae]|uniref:DinB family protein n=1 Tax=Cellulomonas fengjieae TaxID=2819978 RepID=A0ABS3SKD5_9CELL|nr:DinB family protein [Cellulomonas fengjieae]MBO3085819.1 DinB family protein [Cellulomonas fengjieae]MBO3102929.1 DinB family protein [Cellulomonas fengjieae]QVI67478.1 DinB family protein [Cellulomonas fengjieae]